MSTATVTMEYAEFQAHQDAKKAAEIENAQLREQITQARIAASDQTLLTIARAAIDVVRYAVASLPPESNRGWPFESLRTLGLNIESMPDASSTHSELAIVFKQFADECEMHERRRKLAREVKQDAPPSLAELAQKSSALVAPADQDP